MYTTTHTNLYFSSKYNTGTNIILETSINLVLAFLAFSVGVFVYLQLNLQEDIFKDEKLVLGEDLDQFKVFSRLSNNNQNNFVNTLAKYDQAESLLIIVYILLVMLIIIIDGIFGVIYTLIMASWLLSKLYNKDNELEGIIQINKYYLNYIKIFTFITCYAGIIWKLNVFNNRYRGATLIINGYVTEYGFLFFVSFLV